jgi:hypothetical protein
MLRLNVLEVCAPASLMVHSRRGVTFPFVCCAGLAVRLGDRMNESTDRLVDAIEAFSPLLPYRTTAILIDTNMVYRSLRYMVKSGRPSELITLARARRANLFFPEQGLAEIARHLGEIADQARCSLDRVEGSWIEGILPHLRVIPAACLDRFSPLEGELRHTADAPFVRAWTELQPDWFFSVDKDVRVLGLTPPVPDEVRGMLPVVAVLTEYHAAQGTLYQVQAGALSVTLVGGAALSGAVAAGGALFRSLRGASPWVWAIVGGIIAGVLVAPPSRRWLQQQLANLLDSVQATDWDPLRVQLEEFVDVLATAQRTRAEARDELLSWQASVQPRPPKTASEYLRFVLSRSPVPLTVKQAVEEMRRKGYRSRGEQPERYLRQLLRTSPWFFESAGSKWGVAVPGRRLMV